MRVLKLWRCGCGVFALLTLTDSPALNFSDCVHATRDRPVASCVWVMNNRSENDERLYISYIIYKNLGLSGENMFGQLRVEC